MSKQYFQVIIISVLMICTINSASAHSWQYWGHTISKAAGTIAGSRLLYAADKAIKGGKILLEEFSPELVAAVEKGALEAAAIALIV